MRLPRHGQLADPRQVWSAAHTCAPHLGQEYGASLQPQLVTWLPRAPVTWLPPPAQEYGASCPQPNTRRVYISYVDSVKYFESSPAGHRSTVYRALLCAYMRICRARGFKHVHIWVEPPRAGDEYTFYASNRGPLPGYPSPLPLPGYPPSRYLATPLVQVHLLRAAARAAQADEAREAARVVLQDA